MNGTREHRGVWEVLACAWLFSACCKFVSLSEPAKDDFISFLTHLGIGVLELVAAVALWYPRLRRLGLLASSALISGFATRLAVGPTSDCGCFGTLALGFSARAFLVTGLCVLVILGLRLAPPSKLNSRRFASAAFLTFLLAMLAAVMLPTTPMNPG